MPDESDIKIKSVKKVVDVLNCFIIKQPLGITEISEMLGTYKSNVHRIVTSLAALDYLEQDKNSGKYYLGTGALKLSRAVGEQYNFHNIVAKYAKMLADETGEIVRVSLPMDKEVYYLDTICPTGGHFSVGNMIAAYDPMHCTSCGKAMMAYMPDSFVEAYFSSPVKVCTEHTINKLDDMRIELEKIRQQGYSVDNNEASLNVTCVGTAILGPGHAVVGALSISGISQNFTQQHIEELAGKLKKYARIIETLL